MLANIVIPTHQRKTVLDLTLRALATYFGESAAEFNVVIVDSSPSPNRSTRDEIRQWGGYEYVHVPRLHPFRKLLVADNKLDNDLPVLYATDEDLFGYSPTDIVEFAEGGKHYSTCQYLLFRKFVLDDGRRGYHFWQGWDHFVKASLCSTPVERLKQFGREGVPCIYGLHSNSAFKLKAWGMSALTDAIGDGAASTIVEDLANLATLCLSWHCSNQSWCFRFLDRGHLSNKEWRGSWIMLDQIRRQDEPLLKVVCDLFAHWITKNLQICKVPTPNFNENDYLQLLVSHTEGYYHGNSRKWRKGKDYLYVPGLGAGKLEFLLLPEDADRPFFMVPKHFVLSEIDEQLFEGEWVRCAKARRLFHAMADNVIDLRISS